MFYIVFILLHKNLKKFLRTYENFNFYYHEKLDFTYFIYFLRI